MLVRFSEIPVAKIEYIMRGKHDIETERLIIIPFGADDLHLLHRTFTDSFVRKYLWDDQVISLDETKTILDVNNDSFTKNGWGLWKMIVKEGQDFAGFAGLWTFFGETQPQLLFGLLPAKAGFGYATESSKAIIDYAFSKLNFAHLFASFDPPNHASEKVCQRLSMTKTKDKEMNGKLTTFYQIDRDKYQRIEG